MGKENALFKNPILFNKNSYYIFIDQSSSYNMEVFFAVINPNTNKMYIYECWGL
ncbi:MAG: hypothetical protein K0S34_1031 [Bacillales bacterium]|jgi:hypothetical protein|nr:hypothetical protein [Bacillales bacterium]